MPGSGPAGSFAKSVFAFLRNHQCVSRAAGLLCILTSIVAPHLHPHLALLEFFSHSRRYTVASHSGFKLHFPNVKHLFKAYLSSVYLLWRSNFCPTYWVVCFLIVEFESSIYILGTSPLTDMWSVHIFSQVCLSSHYI